jgi:serine/threonine protein kinase
MTYVYEDLMPIHLIRIAGDGAFGDVWEAKDELDRTVAVKIIRAANVGVADALAHAKALARVVNPNVVQVYSLTQVPDPESGVLVDCVVMEFIDGETLDDLFESKRLDLPELRRIGHGILNGLEHIQLQGLAHGDLHNGNIMVTDTAVKIIDILYRDTLAMLSTVKRDERLQRDLRAVRIMLQDMMAHSELDPAEAGEFNTLLHGDATLQQIGDAFEQITRPEAAGDDARQLEHVYNRFLDEAFVDSEDYALAVSEVTPPRLTLPLLLKITQMGTFDTKHRRYAKLLWQRLAQNEQAKVVEALSNKLDTLMPKGRWWPHLRLLSALGENAWKLLPRVTQLRVEGIIINDTLAGYYDIYANPPLSKGFVGTYALNLWPRFTPSGLTQLAENLVSMLRQSWYTQNYVGKFFMSLLPILADRTNRTPQVLEALSIAYANDARLIKNGLPQLPEKWIQTIAPAKAKSKIDDLDDDIPF